MAKEQPQRQGPSQQSILNSLVNAKNNLSDQLVLAQAQLQDQAEEIADLKKQNQRLAKKLAKFEGEQEEEAANDEDDSD